MADATVEPPRDSVPPVRQPGDRAAPASARRALMWASVVVAAVALAVLVVAYSRWRRIDSLEDLTLNEPVKLAVEIRLDQASKCFDLTVLLAAAILGLFVAKPGEGRLLTSDRPELTMSACTVTLVAVTLLLNHSFTSQVHEALLAGGSVDAETGVTSIPDVVGGHFAAIYNAQWAAWAASCFLAGVTLFSAHRLRGADS